MTRLLALLAFFASAFADSASRFEEWAERFDMRFEDGKHRNYVFANWISNDRFIEETNAKNLTYTLAHNHLSGMNQEEYSAFIARSGKYESKIDAIKCVKACLDEDASNMDKFKCVKACKPEDNDEDVSMEAASSIDWRTKGAVTDVKDQGQCGSCWSFSTTGALEGAYAIKNGKLVAFSEQQLVDCDKLGNGGRDHGCNGGIMDNAFDWIGKNNGLCTEDDYPYFSGTTKDRGDCQTSCTNVKGSDIQSHTDIAPSSDSAMMSALTKQPAAIAIEADQRAFQMYSSGVFTGACGTNLDHGVLAVGYGSDSNGDYYIVKNSWSASWGDKGYIRLGRGSQYNNGDGQCGMLLMASYPCKFAIQRLLLRCYEQTRM